MTTKIIAPSLLVLAFALSSAQGQTLSVTDCDRLAAAPLDLDRITEGVASSLLDHEASLAACRAALEADPENPRLLFQMGRVLDFSDADDEAALYYRRAIGHDYTAAYAYLAYQYDNGDGVKEDVAEAVRLSRIAEARDDPTAHFNLGVFYKIGRGVERDLNQARQHFEAAAKAGHMHAFTEIAISEYDEAQSQREFAAVLSKFRRAAQSDYEVSDAMFMVGHMLAHGQGTSRDALDALEWFRKAAALGHAEAAFAKGEIYENYTDYGIAIGGHMEEALIWYRRAADLGHAGAMNDIGHLYDHGKGIVRDLDEAVRWYSKAAEAGNPTGMSNLGAAYTFGWGDTEIDYAQGRYWLLRAADADLAAAKTRLSFIYSNGLGVARDDVVALRWTKEAAEGGHTEGMSNYGIMLQNGTGVEQDTVEGLRWLEKAAELNEPLAFYNLGFTYREGLGVEVDMAKAREWFERAAGAGVAEAREWLDANPEPANTIDRAE